MKWIDVRKCLPENEKRVLFYDPYWRTPIRMGFFYAEAECFKSIDDGWAGRKIGEVTHWMELPSPPGKQ